MHSKRAIAALNCSSELNLNCFNPIAFRKAKIVYNFGLSECNRVKVFASLHKLFIKSVKLYRRGGHGLFLACWLA